MRYVIRIDTFKTGRKEYTPQVRVLFLWFCLDFNGRVTATNLPQDTMEEAINRIEKHYAGNMKIVKTEYKLINTEL